MVKKFPGSKVVAVVLTLLAGSALLVPAGLMSVDKAPVSVFIIDSAQSTRSHRPQLFLDDIGHGRAVTAVLEQYCKPARLYMFDVDDADGNVDTRRYLRALNQTLHYLEQGDGHPAVVNISLGIADTTDRHRRLIDAIAAQGALVVAAAGNDNSSQSSYPAAFESVIAVGAAHRGVRESYSNYGDIDIFARGRFRTGQLAIRTSQQGLTRHWQNTELSGTSFAAPRVSAVAARMLQSNPRLGTEQILEAMRKTATSVAGFDVGSLDELQALATVSRTHAVMVRLRRLFLSAMEYAGLGLVGLALAGAAVAMAKFLFRLAFADYWSQIKINAIGRIMSQPGAKTPRQMRYIVDCLQPGYPRLFQAAQEALRQIGIPAVKYLIESWHYNAENQFVDYKKPLYELISTIGGHRAEQFCLQLKEQGHYNETG